MLALALAAVGIFLYVVLPLGLIPPLDAWAHRHEELTMGVMFAPLPLAMLFGSFGVAFSEGGLGLLLIRSSSPLSQTLSRSVRALRSHWALIIPPALTVSGVTALLAWIAWQAIHMTLPAGAREATARSYALALILRPRTLAVYLAVGFALLFSNAVLGRAYLDYAREEPVSLLTGIGAALRISPALVALAVILFGGMLVGQLAWGSLRERLPRNASGLLLGRLVEFLLALLENGALLGANLLIVVMLAERVGPLDAAARVSTILRGRASDAARAVFGLSAISYEGPVAIVLGCFGFAVLALPYFGDLGSIDRVVSLWLCGLLAGCFFAAVIAIFINTLQIFFAAGLYLYASSSSVAPAFEAQDFRRILEDGAGLGSRLVA